MLRTALFAALLLSLAACNSTPTDESKTVNNATDATTAAPRVVEEPVRFALPGAAAASSKSLVAYDQARTGKLPIVLVLPEWWGLTEYPQRRARQFAEMGYLAMAVDLYGDGKIAGTPDSAGAAAGPFYANPAMAKSRIDAALAKARSYPQADTSRVLLVGYCFGGGMTLNAARLGGDYTAVASFHGSLTGVPAVPGRTRAKVFVAHGAADAMVPAADVAAFRRSMDSAGVSYTFREYAGATHAFTNPAATENGKKFGIPIAYNAVADSASWADMKAFLGEAFR